MAYTFSCLGVRQIAQSARAVSPAMNAKGQSRHFGPAWLALIVWPVVATKGRRTKGKPRSPPSVELCRAKRSATDVSVGGHLQLFSFDHLIGSTEQWKRNSKAERLCCFKIHDEFNVRRLLDWQIDRLLSL